VSRRAGAITVPLSYAAPPVLVVMGVAGSGKSTVGRLVAAELGWDFGEGDALHPAANVAKMAAGTPLTDDDRKPWLARVRAWIDEHVAAGRPGVIACSALKRAYRDALRDPHVVFVHLAGSRERLAARLAARQGHFMPATLLDSQLAALEPPGAGEQALTVDIAAPPAEQARSIIDVIMRQPGR
jgi:carbohydrate kinase (thermoresistant glucokinase family)